jgi:Arc/MetJ-type ribon-helix-helix transcriptional regulator
MADTEKVTVNLGVVDLGQVDLLVEQGFYSSRSDFIRTAIRNQLSTHSNVVQDVVVRRQMVVGVLSYNRQQLEKVRAKGQQLDIGVVGLVNIGSDVTPELASDTIQRLKVHGVLRAEDGVKRALADRIV